uniref:G-protein coupled receptors family 1 profile domain-containing protein n=1 Tax=Parascaris univalens TaxID=6257 RepID=A0A915C309_PARUN
RRTHHAIIDDFPTKSGELRSPMKLSVAYSGNACRSASDLPIDVNNYDLQNDA